MVDEEEGEEDVDELFDEDEGAAALAKGLTPLQKYVLFWVPFVRKGSTVRLRLTSLSSLGVLLHSSRETMSKFVTFFKRGKITPSPLGCDVRVRGARSCTLYVVRSLFLTAMQCLNGSNCFLSCRYGVTQLDDFPLTPVDLLSHTEDALVLDIVKRRWESSFQRALSELGEALRKLEDSPCLTYPYEDMQRSWHGRDGRPMPLWTAGMSAQLPPLQVR